jgi:hypothetical protein
LVDGHVLSRTPPVYFLAFFFAAAFFLAGAFLVAFFIELILPISNLAILKSQCDSYIESRNTNVKKKMRLSARRSCWFARRPNRDEVMRIRSRRTGVSV